MATYLSQLLDKPVWDAQGRQIGRCLDVLVAEAERGFPPVCALAVSQNGAGQLMLVAARCISLLAPSIVLGTVQPEPYTPSGQELWLKRQVLDRQVVDTEGHRLVRVNDLELTRVGTSGPYYLTGVSVGTMSLLRRLGLEGIARRLFHALRREPPERVIPWQEVASIRPDAAIQLRITRDKISQIHPADLAEILAELDRPSGQALVQTLDNETVADAISEAPPEVGTAILTALPPERAADVLEEMSPDDAADVLGALESEDRSNLLGLMEAEEAFDVARLLEYPPDTAGGIMTTEFATVPVGLSAGQALEYLRQSEQAREDEALYYVHVVDEQGRLISVVSLRDLVLADPRLPVATIAEREPISVGPLTPQVEVARLIAKYNLLSLPVVDEEGVLLGIVTVDDAIDAVIPTAWKKRLPRIF